MHGHSLRLLAEAAAEAAGARACEAEHTKLAFQARTALMERLRAAAGRGVHAQAAHTKQVEII